MEAQKEDVTFVGLPDIDVRLEDGVLVSQIYGDIYFNRTDGLAESDYVFLQGTDLAEMIKAHHHVTIAETGFGTGLNFLAACALRDEVNPHCQIDFISFEACPLNADFIQKAHAPYASLQDASYRLADALPPRWPGYHKVILDEGRTHLHLYYGKAEALLKRCDFAADIWFLDGFNPASNPELWQQELLDDIYRCSAPHARLATFTAASHVRRGLIQAGFQVQKRKGFGRKRDMLIAQGGKAKLPINHIKSPKTAVIIGGGIAGASLAYALHKRGIKAHIIEKGPALASGASGNGAAMQSARLRVHNDAQSRLSVACLSYARKLSQAAGAIAHHGAVTLNNRDKDQKRLEKLARSGWPEALFQAVDSQQASDLITVPTTRSGEFQPASAVIKPKILTNYLAQSATCDFNLCVQKIISHNDHHEIVLETGEHVTTDLLFLASGASIPEVSKQSGLPSRDLQISAGQVSFWPVDELVDSQPDHEQPALSDTAYGVNYGGYMTPVIDGYHYLGASFNRDGQSEVTLEGHEHNIALLPDEWQEIAPHSKTAKGRLSYRLSTKDRMPLCGPVTSDDAHLPIYLIGALGARGMTNAPLLADMLVSQALGLFCGFDRQIIADLSV